MSAVFEDLTAALKKAAKALRDADVPFLVAGGLASYARGGPPTEHDVDLAVKPADAERALAVLEKAGMRGERPPEEWLFKVYDEEANDAMIDIIFRPVDLDIDDGFFERADEMEVEAVKMAVMSADDILTTKLLALSEHHVDYDSVLEAARSLREQIDFESVRERTTSSPYAKAFFTLVEELGIAS
jgi:predicted nucleotidyltransferase